MKIPVLIMALFCAGVGAANTVEVVWNYEPPAGHVDTSPALGDLDGDGRMDIVLGTIAGVVVALDVNARELWRHEMRSTICVPPAVADVTGDGRLNVAVMDRQGRVHCLSGSTGDVVWEATLPNTLYWGETVLAVGDVTDDGNLEIVTGDGHSGVVCLNGKGETLWVYRGDHGITQAPAIADLAGDGVVRILVGGDKIPLVCLSAEGRELWRSENGIGSSPLVYDITGDGANEILVGVNEYFTARDISGKEIWRYQMQREMDSAITVADADGNGDVEIYVADLAGNLVSLTPDGQLRWSANVKERVRRSPTVGDVTGDGEQDILVAGYAASLFVFAPDGRLKESVAVPRDVNSSAVIIPMADGAPGVILPVSNDTVRLLRWPGAQPRAVALWPEYRFDSRRAGSPQELSLIHI